jgi:hypothetical protein
MLLIVLATGDHAVPSDMRLKTCVTALDLKKLLLPVLHFDPCQGETFLRNRAEQVTSFTSHLST